MKNVPQSAKSLKKESAMFKRPIGTAVVALWLTGLGAPLFGDGKTDAAISGASVAHAQSPELLEPPPPPPPPPSPPPPPPSPPPPPNDLVCLGLLPSSSACTGGASPGSCRGTPGNDRIVCLTGPCVIHGLGGDDIITGSTAVLGDTICAGSGHDRVDAAAGPDRVFGGPGNDMLNGQGGADMLFGGYGDDTIKGGLGPDTIDGGPGNDHLEGNQNTDTMNGRAGTDRCVLQDIDVTLGCETN